MKTLSINSLQDILSLLEGDLLAVDALIHKTLSSEVPLIETIAQHIVDSGGKRLRPMLVVLSAKACGYENGNEHYELAVVIEFIHTATLLHDDVIDKSQLRRGNDTANMIWGNPASVLVGDFLYSRAFQLLASRTNIPVMKLLANATNRLVEAEVKQLMNQHDPNIQEDEYFKVIDGKTGRLFQAATQIGAMLGNDDEHVHTSLANYGLNLGIAFQIIDDLLDYTASPEKLGKNIGDDFAEGKLTLPLIHALRHAPDHLKQYIRECINSDNQTFDINPIIEALTLTGAEKHTHAVAISYMAKAKAALQKIPNSVYKKALEQLCDFVLERHH